MSFKWPIALALAGLVPVLLGLYIWGLRRKRRNAVVFSNVALLRAAMPKASSWKRHVPVGLFLASILGLSVATARPQADVTVPLTRSTILLALDVSRSMCATDIAPNRLAAAQQAARSFIEDQGKGTRIGIVAFSGFSEVIVAPTDSKESLLKAVDNLTTGRGTAIGSALLKSINAIAADNPDVAPTESAAFTPLEPTEPLPEVVAPAGDFVSDIVVLLTDGANTRGVGPIEAATQAVDRRVRVYTIGFGTQNPTELSCSAEQLGGESFDGNFGGGSGGAANRQFLVADDETLTQVATMTGGEFFRAENAEQLNQVFADLPTRVELQTRQRELSIVFAALGALLLLAAMALSLLWNRGP